MRTSNAATNKALSIFASLCLHGAVCFSLLHSYSRVPESAERKWQVTRLFLPRKGTEDPPQKSKVLISKKGGESPPIPGSMIDLENVRLNILPDERRQLSGVLARHGGLLGVASVACPRVVVRVVDPATGSQLDQPLTLDDWIVVRIWEPESWPSLRALGVSNSELAYGLFPRSF